MISRRIQLVGDTRNVLCALLLRPDRVGVMVSNPLEYLYLDNREQDIDEDDSIRDVHVFIHALVFQPTEIINPGFRDRHNHLILHSFDPNISSRCPISIAIGKAYRVEFFAWIIILVTGLLV
jgi:hypothetical protein